MTEDRVPRRSFLTTAAATVAGAALGVATSPIAGRAAESMRGDEDAAAPAPPHEIKLGIASYSLREFPLDKALEMAKSLRTH